MEQPNFSPNQPVNSDIPLSQKNNKNLIIIGIILLLLVGVGSYFLGAKSQQNKPSTLIEAIPTTEMKQEITPTSIPTQVVNNNTLPNIQPTNEVNNWKTYTETREIKFTLQYPPNWTVNTQDGMHGEKGATFDSGSQRIGSVSIGWNSQPQDPNCEHGQKEQVQLKNQAVTMCYYAGSTQQPEQFYYVSSQNGKQFVLDASNYPGEQNENIILKVLSTLSFNG
jgi:hypothetical protein